MSVDIYEIMGIGHNFTGQKLRDRMKELAKKFHPDRKGGDKDKFQEMMGAYDLLRSPIKRARYDETGETKAEPPFQVRFREMVTSMFLQIAESIDSPTRQDLIEILKKSLYQNIESGEESLESLSDKIEKLQEIKKRVTFKGDGPNIIIDSLTWKIEQMKNKIPMIKEDLDFLVKAKNQIDDYGYDFEQADQTRITMVMNPIDQAIHEYGNAHI